MRSFAPVCTVAAMLFACLLSLPGQVMRHIAQPQNPPTRIVLHARLAAVNGFVGDLRESNLIAENADFTLGRKVGNFVLSGKATTTQPIPDSLGGQPVACARRSILSPALRTTPRGAGKAQPADPTFHVAADGTGDYSSIQRAIDAAPSTGAVIVVAPGVYRERLTVTKPTITLRGLSHDPGKTVVTGNRSASTAGGDVESATVEVTADNFLAESMTFENDYDDSHPKMPEGSQALALAVSGDRDVFENLRLISQQDTLYAGSKGCRGKGADRTCTAARQYFDHCYIAGNFDFIFGDAKAVFNHCTIYSRQLHQGFITAQSKSYPQQDSGFVFNGSRLTSAPGVHNVYLGRPWRPYATVVYLNTWMGRQIAPAGWHVWQNGAPAIWRDWPQVPLQTLSTAFFAEYRSTGPGADPSRREPYAKHLTREQAQKFEPGNFLRGSDGWDPTSVAHKTR